MIGIVKRVIAPGQSRRGSTGCSERDANRRGGCPERVRGGEATAPRTRNRTGGTCRSWETAPRRSGGRARRGRRPGATGCAEQPSRREGSHLLEQLVYAFAQPREAVRLGRLDETGANDQHVVVA